MTQAGEPVPAMSMHEYFNKVISFESLYKGLKKSCRNVRWKDSVVGYEANGLKNTQKLQEELENGSYRISPYQRFEIYEPKKREILASRLRDRQVQRALCDAGLYQDITEHFIRDNAACQIGKGTDDAMRRLKVHLQKYYRKHGAKGWVLRCDIEHFFPSTKHEVAKTSVGKLISDERVKEMVFDVIDSFGGEQGIGLGSQISQLVELSVLNGLDHFIKEKLCIKGYIRYMDDFVLICESKERLQECRKEIKRELEGLGLRLNRKTCIHPLEQGIVFLGWRFLLTESGKVVLKMRKEKRAKERRRLRKMVAAEKDGRMPKGTSRRSLEAWCANALRGDEHESVRKMKLYYREMTQNDECGKMALSKEAGLHCG